MDPMSLSFTSELGSFDSMPSLGLNDIHCNRLTTASRNPLDGNLSTTSLSLSPEMSVNQPSQNTQAGQYAHSQPQYMPYNGFLPQLALPDLVRASSE
jgi:hypothetical protein